MRNSRECGSLLHAFSFGQGRLRGEGLWENNVAGRGGEGRGGLIFAANNLNSTTVKRASAGKPALAAKRGKTYNWCLAQGEVLSASRV